MNENTLTFFNECKKERKQNKLRDRDIRIIQQNLSELEFKFNKLCEQLNINNVY